MILNSAPVTISAENTYARAYAIVLLLVGRNFITLSRYGSSGQRCAGVLVCTTAC